MDILDLAKQVTTIGLPTSLVVILILSKMKVWAWYWAVEDCEKRAAERLAEQKTITEEWKAVAKDARETAKTWKSAATE